MEGYTISKRKRFVDILKKNKKFFFLVVVILIALFFRLNALEWLSIEADESAYVRVGGDYREMLINGSILEITKYDNYVVGEEGYKWHYTPHIYEHPSFSKVVYGTAFIAADPQTYNDKVLTGRLTSVIFSIIIVILLFIINPFAALAFSLNDWAIKYGSIVYLEPIWMTFSLLSLIFFIKSYSGQEFCLV